MGVDASVESHGVDEGAHLQVRISHGFRFREVAEESPHLLSEPSMAAEFLRVRECMMDQWTLEMKCQWPTFDGEELLQVLYTIASVLAMDIARYARGYAWRLAKNILKLNEKDKATFFSPTNEWCLPAPSVIKPEKREFVVDSGASMHMLSRKNMNSAELETVRVSKSPTAVVTGNSEVHAKEEATVYVRELD